MAVPNADVRAKEDGSVAEASSLPSFALVCDSSCDLDPAVCRRNAITLVSHRITLSDIELLDRSMSGGDVTEMLASNVRVRSSAPGHGSYASVFAALVEEGHHDIVVACPSSQLLGAYDAAVQAAHEVSGARIQVIDTKCVSGQLGLVVACLAQDREDGLSADEAVARVPQVVEASRMWTLLPPTVDLENAHVLGNARGLRRSIKSLSMRMSGGWIMTTVDADAGTVTTLRHSDDLSWLAGIVARSVSLFSQERGPVTLVEMASVDEHALAELRRPLDTNEFEKELAGTLSLRPSTLTVMGAGAVGVVAVPQDVVAPARLAAFLSA